MCLKLINKLFDDSDKAVGDDARGESPAAKGRRTDAETTVATTTSATIMTIVIPLPAVNTCTSPICIILTK